MRKFSQRASVPRMKRGRVFLRGLMWLELFLYDQRMLYVNASFLLTFHQRLTLMTFLVLLIVLLWTIGQTINHLFLYPKIALPFTLHTFLLLLHKLILFVLVIMYTISLYCSLFKFHAWLNLIRCIAWIF